MNSAKFKSYRKGTVKVLMDYLTFMLAYVFLIINIMRFVVIEKILDLYSLAVFSLLFVVLYSDMELLGEKDRLAKSEKTGHPLKGFVMGFFAILPLIFTVIGFHITGDPQQDRAKELLLNSIMSPLYNFFKLGNETFAGYLLSTLVIPLTSGLGYLAGYKDFIIENKIRKLLKLNPRTPKRKLR